MKGVNIGSNPRAYLLDLKENSSVFVPDYSLYRKWYNAAMLISRKNGVKFSFKKKHMKSGQVGFIVKIVIKS